MNNEFTVTSFSLLRNSRLTVETQEIFSLNGLSNGDFFDEAYHALKADYPRFYKMDHLCKTGFIAAELLLRDKKLSARFAPEEIGIVFSNRNSSLDTDMLYEASLASAPSPSLFIYTLPNILIGELCIRHGIKGESACFVFDIFDAVLQTDYVNMLLGTGKIKICLSGWADYYKGKPEAFFYLVEKGGKDPGLKHDSVTVQKLFLSHE